MAASRIEGFRGFWALRFPGTRKLEQRTRRESHAANMQTLHALLLKSKSNMQAEPRFLLNDGYNNWQKWLGKRVAGKHMFSSLRTHCAPFPVPIVS